MSRESEIDDQIAKLQAEKKSLQEAKVNVNPETAKLAIELHRLFCTANHTDGCGFYYEVENRKGGVDVHDWSGYSHQVYFKKAQAVLPLLVKQHVSVYQFLSMIEAVVK